MVQSTHTQPFFFYVIEIENKEFPLVIMRDGTSHWDDHTERRKSRHPCYQDLEVQALAGNRLASQRLQNELLEFTVSATVPQQVFLKAVEMVQKEQIEESRTRKSQNPVGETAKDIAEMDQLLKDFFWLEMNPLLIHPLTNPSE